MATKRYDVTPDPTLMEDIGATSFTVPEAVVELVANSIDARMWQDQSDASSGLPLTVEILISPEEIRVADDAKGMSEDILAEAVRLGVKMDRIQKGPASRKGMFGLGLKTAAASLGSWWQIVTRPAGGGVEYALEFDLDEWRRHVGDASFRWEVEIEERQPVGGPLGDRAHGTAIVIKRLRERNPLPGAVLERVGQAYKPHLEEGDRIFVNGDEAIAKTFEFLPDSRHDVDITTGENGEYRIHGWVALDIQTHNDTNFGFNLYREGQLLEPWNKDWFPVHLMTSRIIGEVHLDFVPPNFHKKGFETQSPQWKLASVEMREFLKPLVRASREASRGRKDAGRFTRAVEGLKVAMGKATEVGPLRTEEGEPVADEPAGEPSEIGIEEEVIVLPDGSKVHLTYVVEEFQSDQTPWDYIYDAESEELAAVVNSASRLFLKVKDEGFLGMLALADSVSNFLIEHKGFGAVKAREVRDRWLYLSLGA
jgi:hypothetical protein